MGYFARTTVFGVVKGEPSKHLTTAGKPYVKLTVRYTESFGKGEDKSYTNIYYNLVAWGENLSELIGRTVHDGDQLLVECKYTPNTYEKDGKNVTFPQFTLISFTWAKTSASSGTAPAPEQHESDEDLPF